MGVGTENKFDMGNLMGSVLTDLIQWCHNGRFWRKELSCWNDAQKQTVESSLVWGNSVTKVV